MLRPFARALAVAFVLSAAATAAQAASAMAPMRLATGELLVHAAENGMPLPAESKWMLCAGAGPSFVPEGGRHRLNWVVHLKDKDSLAKSREITRVRVEEVSGTTAMPLYDGAPKITDQGLFVMAPEAIVSADNHPWLFTPKDTLVVLRVVLTAANGEQDKLLQPVLIRAVAKRNLRANGIGG